MQARLRFGFVRRNPLQRSCVSRARNAGESAICVCPAQPSAEIARVERAKRRRECDLCLSGATLCGTVDFVVPLQCGAICDFVVQLEYIRGVSGDLEDENWRLSSRTLVHGVSGELEDENWRLCSTTYKLWSWKLRTGDF